MKTEYTDYNQNTSGKEQWQRNKVASAIIDFQLAKGHISQRQFAKTTGIPRTTLQHWLSRKEALSIFESPELIEFFESPVGVTFLNIMSLAAHYEFTKKGSASIHNVSNYFKRCGLERFIGTSYATQRIVSNDMDKAIVAFGESEQKKLAEIMPEKWITLCEDETFHPAICMVAIDAQSNFILLEEYVDKRDAQTWNRVVEKALDGMPVKVVQVTSDEAKGLINHAEVGLGAHHSPDIFHVQQEIVKGTSGALSGIIKKSEKQLEVATTKVQKEKKIKAIYDSQPKHPPGRPPNFEAKIKKASSKLKKTETELEAARKNQEIVKLANQEISKCYHPYNPETGEKQNAEKVSELLELAFATIYSATTELSDRCMKRIEKAHRVVKNLVASIAFFFVMIDQYMENMGISKSERKIMHDYLIPGFYLQMAARKEKEKTRRQKISDKSEELLSILSNPYGPLSDLSVEMVEFLVKSAKDCAGIFQRSSSCVEGRNAQLSLKHHGIHRLSPQHLMALTVVHNYDTRNKDGTTPAERFFEALHNDLFEWLLKNMPFPVRPRKRLKKAA